MTIFNATDHFLKGKSAKIEIQLLKITVFYVLTTPDY